MFEPGPSNHFVTEKRLKRLRQEAKKHSKLNGCILADSQNTVARNEGFPNWKALKKAALADDKTTTLVNRPEIHPDVSHD